MTALWGLVAAAALLWPGRLNGLLDGVPLDRLFQAVAIGAVFPALWLLHPGFLTTRFARTVILSLLGWHLAASVLLVQDGWCVRFVTARPFAKDAVGSPHAWDVRADWRTTDPACSAIVTRPYHDLYDFPAWFFNLPPPSESWPTPLDRPPGATVSMTISGYLRAPTSGRLAIEQGRDAPTQIFVDGQPSSADGSIEAGVHTVAVRTTLTGDRWRFVPTWNARDLWSESLATAGKPSRLDVFVRRWIAWMPTLLAEILLASWIVSALRAIGDARVLFCSAAASIVMALLVLSDRADLARHAVAALALAAFVPVPQRLCNWRGMFLLVIVPWMTFAVACAAPAIGRFLLYDVGHDYWMFQRYAYRIVMQGYWLEGGSPTFWFQPFYRWIAGVLHVVFGDSSAGEWYWDAACLAAGSIFAFTVVDRVAGFRWAMVAAVVPLATFISGTAQYLLGQGLGEISSAGFVYVAALFAIRARSGDWHAAFVAGVFATLAFYTRLNNLIMATGVVVFAAPLQLNPRRAWREPLIIVATLACGVLLFAWRTWHFTGVFSVVYGTQWRLLGLWQPGMTIGTWLARAASSVAMVLTVNDPPRFDMFALPVLIGAVCAVAAALTPHIRSITPRLLLFFATSIAGALVARGSAYPGRFSVHIIPIASAIAVCSVAAAANGYLVPKGLRTR